MTAEDCDQEARQQPRRPRAVPGWGTKVNDESDNAQGESNQTRQSQIPRPFPECKSQGRQSGHARTVPGGQQFVTRRIEKGQHFGPSATTPARSGMGYRDGDIRVSGSGVPCLWCAAESG